MSKVFNAYIDEAGDEGFTIRNGEWKSSKWFIISALVVPEEFDRDLASVIDDLKDEFRSKNKLKPLHFRSLNHNRKKKVIQEIVNKGHFKIIGIGINKTRLISTDVLKNEKQFLYNYATRYLLERISWLVDEYKRKVNLIFEHRRNTSYKELDSYIQSLLN
ncbi:DUF3800 domain-containing protein [Desulfoscipio geothermicus]|uniref:DUF3800 domain-containing protein n=1 Tax=Desulfoscipio geothermicus DSM 3669 TaxID=1121426 RepID=A0A1I6EGH9_9FIRM|nr:DUF3800 domain-containing protein [Desulfoscipio geothermicus]SFR16850.1 Protein of unknown function [Desulfoscipio geothermicus DSM 3669]